MTESRDKLYPFCLCQDEVRRVEDLTSEEMRSQWRRGLIKERVATVNDTGSYQQVNCGQSNDDMALFVNHCVIDSCSLWPGREDGGHCKGSCEERNRK